MNQVFVVFTYGISMPILFPCLTASLINMYICERLQFAFLYRKPPLFDNSLNDLALKCLQFGPVLMFLSGFWQLGNRQIFFDEVNEKTRLYEHPTTDHYGLAFDFFKKIDHTALLLMYLAFFVSFHKIVKYARKILKHCSKFEKLRIDKKAKKGQVLKHTLENPEIDADELNVDEGLDKYWQCLPGQDQKRWFTKESHLRQ